MISIIKKIFRLCYNSIKAPFVFLMSFFTRLKNIKENRSHITAVPTHPLAHWILWATLACVIIFLIWAKFAVLEEVTVAPATVIPVSQVQLIQNMEGGIIESIPVKEGEVVEKGQVIINLDSTRFLSALDEAKTRAFALEVKVARLEAEVNDKPFQIQMGKNLNNNYLKQLKNALDLYQSRQDQIKQLQKNYDFTRRELEMTEPLVKVGAASEVEILHLKRQLSDLKNQIADFNTRALNELEATRAEFATLNASMLALQDRVNRTTIRAPVKGIVKQIRIGTKSGVVQPGSEIMSIVPLEDSLLVQAQVKPSDIGFIHPGQTVSIKITAYDYSIYGGLSGEVDQVSADTITNDKGRSYYLVRIKTHKNYLRTAQNPLYIIPGMTASVNILTGRKTVLNYLLSPLLKAQQSALRER